MHLVCKRYSAFIFWPIIKDKQAPVDLLSSIRFYRQQTFQSSPAHFLMYLFPFDGLLNAPDLSQCPILPLLLLVTRLTTAPLRVSRYCSGGSGAKFAAKGALLLLLLLVEALLADPPSAASCALPAVILTAENPVLTPDFACFWGFSSTFSRVDELGWMEECRAPTQTSWQLMRSASCCAVNIYVSAKELGR